MLGAILAEVADGLAPTNPPCLALRLIPSALDYMDEFLHKWSL